MLGNSNVSATIAVNDMERAKEFYGQTLGLESVSDGPTEYAAVFKSGNTSIFLYVSENAGTNKATCATWDVADPASVTEELRSKGVQFEHYPDMPGVTMEGDLHVNGSEKVAWFKDPFGNILCVGSKA